MDYPFVLARATWLLFRMHLGTIFGSRRTLAGIALAAIPPLLAFLSARLAADQYTGLKILLELGVMLMLGFIVPMLAVSLGVGVVADESESRTITYPFTRPIPRAALFLGRWLATLACMLVLIGVSAMAMAYFAAGRDGAAPEATVLKLVLAALVGTTIYSLGAAVIGVLSKRGLVIALGYAFAIEVLLANLPGSSQRMTVQYYLRSIFLEGEEGTFGPADIIRPEDLADSGSALIRMAVIGVALLLVGMRLVTRRQFVLSS